MKYFPTSRIFSALSFAILFTILFLSKSYATPPKNAQLTINLPSTITTNTTLSSSLFIELNHYTKSIKIEASEKGSIHVQRIPSSLSGPFLSGAYTDLPIEFTVEKNDTGIATITLNGFNDSGLLTWQQSIEIHSISNENTAWLSSSSLIEAQTSQLQDLFAGHSGKSYTNGQRSFAGLITVKSNEDAVEHIPENAATFQLRQVFPQTKGEVLLAATGVTVSGQAQWTDKDNNKHPIPLADVEVYAEAGATDTLLASTKTDATGNYSATFDVADGTQVYTRVYSRSAVADVRPVTGADESYRLESSPIGGAADGASLTIDLVAPNNTDQGASFSVHHALVVIGAYAGKLAGVTPSTIVTRFPTNKSTSLFNGTELHILRLDRWDWDVIHHEYGHYFMSIHKIEDNPGGSHSFSEHLSVKKGKDKGVRLGWGEGWPTFFGIAGQQSMNAASLGITNVGDIIYQDTEDASITLNLETRNGVGEDNEVSVMSALWDLMDTASDGEDVVSYSDNNLFATVKGAGATTIGKAWEAIRSGKSIEEQSLIGQTLGQANIAPVLKTPTDKAELTPTTQFTWEKKGSDPAYTLNDFTIKFYDGNYNVLFEKDVNDTDTFTPTADEITTIMSAGDIVRWGVEGKATNAPETPDTGKYYMSGLRTINSADIAFVIDDTGSMGQEIEGVKAALQAYIEGLPTDTEGKVPTMSLITFKDSVSKVLTTNDPVAMSAAVGSLFASGGGDCPEASGQALAVASKEVSAGGTILFATDASSQPGPDIRALVTNLRAEGVTVNTILSGDCGGLDFKTSGDSEDQISYSGPQGGGSKPDGDGVTEDPSHLIVDAIDDPGQTAIDMFGNDNATAMPLAIDGAPISNTLNNDNQKDVFILNLNAGTNYNIVMDKNSSSVTLSIKDTADIVLQTKTIYSTTHDVLSFTPLSDGSYYLNVDIGYVFGEVPYLLQVSTDDLFALDLGVEFYATLSAQTNGAFVVADDINTGDTTGFTATVLNVLNSTTEPTILAANPRNIPRNVTFAVNFEGRNTNWRSGTSLSFWYTDSSDAKVDVAIGVNSMTVNSATSLSAVISIPADAPLKNLNVTASTPVGDSTEEAVGLNVVTVVEEITTPEALSVEPYNLPRGETHTVLIRGVNTTWNNKSTVSFGSDITVGSINVKSATQIEATITIPDGTSIGFRSVTIINEDFTFNYKARAVFVTSDIIIAATIVEAVPPTAWLGAELTIVLTGFNTHFKDNLDNISFGAGIDVLSFEVISDTQVKVTIKVSDTAEVGYRDIVVTADPSAALLDGFYIEKARPTSPPSESGSSSSGGGGGLLGIGLDFFVLLVIALGRVGLHFRNRRQSELHRH